MQINEGDIFIIKKLCEDAKLRGLTIGTKMECISIVNDVIAYFMTIDDRSHSEMVSYNFYSHTEYFYADFLDSRKLKIQRILSDIVSSER